MLKFLSCLLPVIDSETIDGLIGIGGGVLITPALIYLLSFSHQEFHGLLALVALPMTTLEQGTDSQRQRGDGPIPLLVDVQLVWGRSGARLAVGLPGRLLRHRLESALMVMCPPHDARIVTLILGGSSC